MDIRHKELLKESNRLFDAKKPLLSLQQEIALNFFPEMADFTSNMSLGAEFADHLTSSYPVIARRTLADSLSALLRPVNLDSTSPGVWFSMTVDGDTGKKHRNRAWLERATKIQRKAMYDKDSGFVRATKQGDHCFSAFGFAPLSLELNRNRDTLLYRCWHPRDLAWTENAEGKIDAVHRKWVPTASQCMDTFPETASPKVREMAEKEPEKAVNLRHIVIATERYERRGQDGKKFRTPWVSVWIDVDNDHLIEEVGSWSRYYIIPRWMMVPGSQYPYSPAVTVSLSDARLFQSITLTLLEAGEKLAAPPMVATKNVVRSDVNLQSDGITWVDEEYDERLGPAIRPLYEPRAGEGLRAGFELRNDLRAMIDKAFYLDSLSLPPSDVSGDMTAFEVGQRISEWLRRAMPIFEPMEFDYNGELCSETFDLMMRNGGFGPLREIPPDLLGQDVVFKFESPIHESADRKKGQKLLEAKAALAQAAELDPSVIPMLDARAALRDVISSIGVPVEWTRDDRAMDDINKADAEKAQIQQAAAGAGVAADVAQKLGGAAKDFAAAQQ